MVSQDGLALLMVQVGAVCEGLHMITPVVPSLVAGHVGGLLSSGQSCTLPFESQVGVLLPLHMGVSPFEQYG